MNNFDFTRLDLVRCTFYKTCTLGRLFLNDEFVCYTLEPPIPAYTGLVKPYAIPNGTYDVTLNVQSPKYRYRSPYNKHKGRVPRLLDVPNFEGILIHIGNFAKDTRGCILVGEKKGYTRLYNSTKAYNALYEKLTKLNKPIKIYISCLKK